MTAADRCLGHAEGTAGNDDPLEVCVATVGRIIEASKGWNAASLLLTRIGLLVVTSKEDQLSGLVWGIDGYCNASL
jgi:hypothetical protein